MTTLIRQRISFRGGDADEHRIEAYPSSQSLEGLVWATSVATHFAVSGKVRQKGNLSSSAKIYLSPPRRGSVEFDLVILVQNNQFISGVLAGYAANVLTPFVNGVIKYAFGNAMGIATGAPAKVKRAFGKLDEEDLSKLVNRIEPPLTRAHKAIGDSVDGIFISHKRRELAQLNHDTKSYLEARLRAEHTTIETNATSFNVLTGNGRLFDPIEHETVPFTLRPNARLGSGPTLLQSMEQYAMGNTGTIKITAQREETSDGRLKRLLVSAAEKIPQSDWIDGADPMRTKRLGP
ncbi:MAG: hypothetical protein AAF376_17540 [Pseudomonadota bacterium]